MSGGWVGVDGIAEHLGISPHTVRKLAQCGTIPFGRAGRSLRFDIEAVDEWMRARGSAGRVAPELTDDARVAEAAAQLAAEIFNDV